MKMLHLNERIGEIVRFHVSLDGFNESVVSEAVALMRSKLAFVRTSSHFRDRETEKGVCRLRLEDVLAKGQCFEYKLSNGRLYRMAFRVEGKNGVDACYVIQPGLTRNGKVGVLFVTGWLNASDDHHSTLRKGAYGRRSNRH